MLWPSQSPDLNSIIHLWFYVKVKVQNLHSSSLPKLKENIIKVWNKILHEQCKKLFNYAEQMWCYNPNNGNQTKY